MVPAGLKGRPSAKQNLARIDEGADGPSGLPHGLSRSVVKVKPVH